MIRCDNPDSAVTAQTIRNAISQYRAEFLNGRTPTMALLDQLVETCAFARFERDGRNRVVRLFMAAPESVALLRLQPHVLVVDCTYKTNRLQMPLLDIVGIASKGRTFFVAQAFLSDEKEDSYMWGNGTP